ncbi:MAG: biotin--[acetyl-CoA-carboxylase] ligase [Corynebacterium sp.]|nr:biotin--[acetyl-CoA-carboxylase] ligase [Corynebacterium sp.]
MNVREPLDIDRIRQALLRAGFADIRYTTSTGSTNTDLVALAKEGAPAWTVILAEQQTAGKGRMGRSYASPLYGQLTLSLLIRPPAESIERIGTMNLATGVGIIDALGLESGIRLKWPNDVIIENRKLCGMLAEAVAMGKEPAVVIGFGLNTGLRREELPVSHATSLYLEDIEFDRNDLTIEVLKAVRTRLCQWQNNDLSYMADYRKVCVTIGQDVRVLLPGNEEVLGKATAVLNDGRIVVVDNASEEHVFAVGDVEHLRLQGGTHWYSR